MVTSAIMGICLGLGSTLLTLLVCTLTLHHLFTAITTKLLGSACHGGLHVIFNAMLPILETIFLFALLWPNFERVPSYFHLSFFV